MIKGSTEQASSELIELLAAAGPGNRGSTHVVLEIKILVVNPDWSRQTKRHLTHALPVPGNHGDSGRYPGQELVITKARRIEDQNATNMHRGLGSIQIQK
jgi:hypothetical protein